MPKGVSVVIPCLNEAGTIEKAVQEALKGLALLSASGEVIVADNGSTDDSAHLARQAGARVVLADAQKGYGIALDAGIRNARYDVVVFADADLSYPFTEIKNLFQVLHEENADLVLGSRLNGKILPGAMPYLNRFVGTPILSFLIRRFFKLPTTDCNSGFRAIRKEAYLKLDLRCPGMEFASEMLIRSAEQGLVYAEAPVVFHRDQRSGPSHLQRWRDGWRHLRFILSNAPFKYVVILPGSIGLACFAWAFILSLETLWNPEAAIHYHSAFFMIALGLPFLLMTMTTLIVKTVLHELTARKAPSMISILQKASETAALFYFSILLYGCGFVQMLSIFYAWFQADFGPLNELSGVVRLVVFAMVATLFFGMDVCLGMLRLLPLLQPTQERSMRDQISIVNSK